MSNVYEKASKTCFSKSHEGIGSEHEDCFETFESPIRNSLDQIFLPNYQLWLKFLVSYKHG